MGNYRQRQASGRLRRHSRRWCRRGHFQSCARAVNRANTMPSGSRKRRSQADTMGGSKLEAQLEALARLSPIEYARVRTARARELGIKPVKFLDEEIKHRRRKPKSAKPEAPLPLDMSELAASAREIIDSTDVLELFETDFAEVVAGEKKLGQLLYLVGTSRLLDQSLHAAIKGTSAGGKTQLRKRVL